MEMTDPQAASWAYQYDLAGNRTGEQTETRSSAQQNPTVVTSSSYNNLNQLTSRSGSGSLPVRFRGTVNESATVAVNGTSAQVFPDPTDSTTTFANSLNMTPGTRSAQVVAHDYGASGGNPRHLPY